MQKMLAAKMIAINSSPAHLEDSASAPLQYFHIEEQDDLRGARISVIVPTVITIAAWDLHTPLEKKSIAFRLEKIHEYAHEIRSIRMPQNSESEARRSVAPRSEPAVIALRAFLLEQMKSLITSQEREFIASSSEPNLLYLLDHFLIWISDKLNREMRAPEPARPRSEEKVPINGRSRSTWFQQVTKPWININNIDKNQLKNTRIDPIYS